MRSLNIVAVCRMPDKMDDAAAVLGGIVDLTAYEAASRLRVSRGVPVVVAVYPDPSTAEDAAGRLESAGFVTVVLKDDGIESEDQRFIVRKFSFEDTRLSVESRDGDKMSVDYGRFDFMLRGTCITRSARTRVEKGRKFSLGRAVISGGLVMSRSTKRHHVDTSESREGFVHLYADDLIMVFRESSLVYSSLGSLMKPARPANFAVVVDELRRRCRNVSFSDSLLARSAQAQILGPLFSPEEDLDIAISLVTGAARESTCHRPLPGNRGRG
ncbi:MAG: hypothetical protein GXP46_01645 [Deferribacteres bacterium]|nr:hypothetical protein [Deferribacteres bacterium]